MLTGDFVEPQNAPAAQPDGRFISMAWQLLKQLHTQQASGSTLSTLVEQLGSILQADRCLAIQFDNRAPLPIRLEYRKQDTVASFMDTNPPWDTCPYLQRTANREFVSIADIWADTSLDDVWCDFFKQHNIRGMLACPIIYGDEILSVLVAHTEAARPWHDDEQQLVQLCANQLAAFLYQEQARQAELRYAINLQQSEERFHSAFAYAPIGMVISDMEGNFLQVNPAFCQIMGFEEAELLNKNYRTITHPDDLVCSVREIQQLCDSHMPGFTLEKRYIKKDGSVIWSNTAVSLIRNHAEQSVNLIAVVEDITERKRTEQALLESDGRFRAMADSAPLFIWLSRQDGFIHYVNKTWTDFLGLPAEDVLAFGMRDAVLAEDMEVSRIIYREAFSRQEPFSLECRIHRADGEIRWLMNKGAPLFLPNGELVGYIGTSIDITDRKAVEEQQERLLSRERLLRQVVEIINESFDLDSILKKAAHIIGDYFRADRCYIIRYQQTGNAMNLQLYGEYARPGIDTMNLSNFPAEMMKRMTQDVPLERVLKIQQYNSSAAYQQELDNRIQALPDLDDAEKLEYSHFFRQALIEKYNIQSLLSQSILYRGTPYGLIIFHQCSSRTWNTDEMALLQDIATQIGATFCQTDLYYQAEETAKREQEARQKLEIHTKKLEISNRELEQFATIASHDLQEPLRKVQMFSQIAADHCNESGKSYIERMQAAVTRMQSLITDLLALSRISRKAQPFRLTNINQGIEAVLADLEVPIQERNADIQVAPLIEIDADAKQLEQLFLNLLSNSLKFHRPNVRPEIRITGRLSPMQTDHYEITLQDNGIGFQPQYQDRIFEPFERLHDRNQAYPGTGMGLTICRKIVERHGGTIIARGVENEGSTFIITLPIRNEGPV